MAKMLKSACPEPGCAALTSGGRCPAHKPKPWARDYPHAGGRAWQRTRVRIFLRDNYRCVYCGGVAEVVDHVLCRAHGGSDDDSNLAACCKACNEQKRQQEARGGRGLVTPTTMSTLAPTAPAAERREGIMF